jgi:hypothetical protein
MEGFNRESRQSIYFEVSYVLACQWPSETMQRLELQKSLAQMQLDFPQTAAGPNQFTLTRTEPSMLQLKISSMGPRVSGLSISSNRPAHSLDFFAKEAQAVCDAYQKVCLGKRFQMLQSMAKIRQLYSCQEHAFKYLWEQRLGQQPNDFAYLGGKSVSGGGLRLVMPPLQNEVEPVQVEVRIESFFPDLKKMFIETAFSWPKPRLISPGEKFDPAEQLNRVEQYAVNEVCNFITLSSNREDT